MSNLRSIEVNIETNSAWVQSGAILGEVYYAIWEKSKVHGFPAGVCPTVAVGGHFSGGGYGNMMRKFGLSVDHIVDAQIVDANGDLLDRKSMGEGLLQDCTEMSWIESVLWYASLNYRSSPKVLLDRKVVRSPNDTNSAKRKSDFVVNPVSREGLGDILKRVAGQLQFSMAFSPHGGEMSEIPASSSPFPHRAGNLYKIEYVGNWNEAGEKAERAVMTQLRRMYSFMAPLVSKNPRRAYLNYRDLDIGKMSHGKGYRSYEEGKVYGMKYFHGNFDRLVKVKTEVDPANFFRDEQSIPTLPMKL
ncbi:unnamed protein product [Linum tenue]|uniref:FAD-binding PCMH-type domain-containing protein n=1 Tax=Linum tenue TaxID=586396 RepID=A0AAV0QNC4_9ROSI|nr:unnamed protein product [Linum tenue]